MTLEQKKARAYDLLAMIQRCQYELEKLNKEIMDEVQKPKKEEATMDVK